MGSKPVDSASRLEQLRQRVAEHPDDARAHLKLGMALAKTESIKSAEAELRRAVELDPELAEAWVNLGGVLLTRWEFKACVDANRKASACQPDLLEAHYNEGLGHMYLGNKAEMLACFERVTELDPNHPSGTYHQAVALLALDRVAEARAKVTRASELGHSPQADFIRTLERAERKLTSSPDKGATKSN